jgi:hypothetical protein
VTWQQKSEAVIGEHFDDVSCNRFRTLIRANGYGTFFVTKQWATPDGPWHNIDHREGLKLGSVDAVELSMKLLECVVAVWRDRQVAEREKPKRSRTKRREQRMRRQLSKANRV